MRVYAQATIGRNIGSQPMSDDQWAQFKRELKGAMGDVTGDPLNVLDGAGQWEDENGATVSEECHAITAIVERHYINNFPTLKRSLAHLAKRYNQDSIGLVIVPLIMGDETLVNAEQ